MPLKLSNEISLTGSKRLISSVAPIIPSAISNLQLWLDSSDAATFIFSSGNVVSQWNDKSGNARNFTNATVPNQPTRSTTQNGNPTVLFDGVNDSLTGPLITAVIDNYAVFGVLKNYSTAVSDRVVIMNGFGTANGWGLAVKTTGTGTFGWNAGGIAFIPTGVDLPTTYNTTSFRRVAGSTQCYINNTAVGTPSVQTPNVPTSWCVLGSHDVGATFINMELAEILIYDKALTVGEVNGLQAYLQNKWATP